MAAYFFADVLEVTDGPKLEVYRAGVTATVEKYGGRYLIVGGPCDGAEGNWKATFPVLIEFPSMAQARRWYDSEDYRELKALRQAAARSNAVFIEGVVAQS